MTRTLRLAVTAVLFTAGCVLIAGCWGHDDEGKGSKGGGSINVAIVDTPNTQDLAHLTPSLFTNRTHIEVNYTILDEGTLREVITSDVPARGRRFDAVMIGPYEAPQFGRDGYIRDLTRMAASDRAYDVGDVIPTVRDALSYQGRLYASPFYGESSFRQRRGPRGGRAAGRRAGRAPARRNAGGGRRGAGGGLRRRCR